MIRLTMRPELALIALVNLVSLPLWSPAQEKPAALQMPAAKPLRPSPAVEQKAVAFGTDENENSKKLNELAAEGWEYVGPLGNGMSMFQRTLANLVDFSRNQDFRIVNVNSAKVLEVEDGSGQNGAKIIQTAYTGAESQHWRLVRFEDTYKIINKKSGKALDVPAATTEQGVQVVQWDEQIANNQRRADGVPNQQWILDKIGKAFRIKSLANDLVLDVEQGSKNDGVRVLQWPYHGGENQLWYVVLVKGK